MPLTIQTFIFNWRGQIQNTERLERLLAPEADLLVINSDEKNERPHWVNIGENAYYTAQYLAALDRVKSDLVFFAQGDCFHSEMREILKASRSMMSAHRIGVYAPDVAYTYYNYNKRRLVSKYASTCYLVPNPDNTCWAIRADLLSKLPRPDPTANRFGLGLCAALCALAAIEGFDVVRDYRWTVHHPRSTGYQGDQAMQQMHAYIDGLPDALRAEVLASRQAIDAALAPSTDLLSRVKRFFARHR